MEEGVWRRERERQFADEMEREDEDATRERKRLFRRALSSLLGSIEAAAAARACRAPVLTFGFYDYFMRFIGAVFDAKGADAILSFEKFCCNLPRSLLQHVRPVHNHPTLSMSPHGDMWAVGAIMAELFSLRPLFPGARLFREQYCMTRRVELICFNDKKINRLLDTGRYRNIMDMNAGLGSFAAAIQSPKLWVMNVMPTTAEKSTLEVIYERGLIGIYHDWCKAFSTYPRTYDLIHANGLFSLYKDKCNAEDILLEMDRILRPEGAVIFRDEVDTLIKVKKIVAGMRWDTKMVDHEDGPLVPKKILIAVKQYWVVDGNSTSTQ
ncbi:putative methyltransferase [Arachis hypogaea]|nr:putative methyltransferase [Arachis hypogaea]